MKKNEQQIRRSKAINRNGEAGIRKEEEGKWDWQYEEEMVKERGKEWTQEE